jgi:hypothetical protein
MFTVSPNSGYNEMIEALQHIARSQEFNKIHRFNDIEPSQCAEINHIAV